MAVYQNIAVQNSEVGDPKTVGRPLANILAEIFSQTFHQWYSYYGKYLYTLLLHIRHKNVKKRQITGGGGGSLTEKDEPNDDNSPSPCLRD